MRPALLAHHGHDGLGRSSKKARPQNDKGKNGVEHGMQHGGRRPWSVKQNRAAHQRLTWLGPVHDGHRRAAAHDSFKVLGKKLRGHHHIGCAGAGCGRLVEHGHRRTFWVDGRWVMALFQLLLILVRASTGGL